MSKFLKFIVNLIVICVVLVAGDADCSASFRGGYLYDR